MIITKIKDIRMSGKKIVWKKSAVAGMVLILALMLSVGAFGQASRKFDPMKYRDEFYKALREKKPAAGSVNKAAITNLVKLTSTNGVKWETDWSPDGKLIAFSHLAISAESLVWR